MSTDQIGCLFIAAVGVVLLVGYHICGSLDGIAKAIRELKGKP